MRPLRLPAAVFLAVLLVPGVARADWWKYRIGRLVEGHAVSVALGNDGTLLYRHRAAVARAPGSNEKLLLSMAILDALGPDFRIPTRAAAAAAPVGGIVGGDLWIVGRGDPLVNRARLDGLARRVAAAGVTRIRGSVMGSVSYFRHDWWAPGWKDYFPRDEVALPTALTFDRNQRDGVHVRYPEGPAPPGLSTLARIESQPLADLLRRQNVDSVNFIAEVLGKLLGARTLNPDGTIAKGASAIEAFTGANGVDVAAFDSSGLSYDDRVRAAGILRLLWAADSAPWGGALRVSLPHANQGTLEGRLRGVRLRAKTGTLKGHSALSGWVWLDRLSTWGEFSIVSQGMSYTQAKGLEDRIVRLISSDAR